MEHGGNKSGIPTVNGSLVFDERFLGKPLVYCGTCGIMPAMINGEPSHTKKAQNGDFIVMSGGRIGKDGIHGATFSSEELSEASPTSAVQIGDPITQKRMTDFLLIARDEGLTTPSRTTGRAASRHPWARWRRIRTAASSTWRRRPSNTMGSTPGRSF